MAASGLSKTQLFLLRGSLRSMVVFGGLWFLVPLLSWRNGDGVDWTGESDVSKVAPGLHLARGAHAYWEGAVHVTIADPSTGLRLIAWLPSAIVAVAVIVTGFLLLRIMYETQEGRPFFESSARRLRLVSLTIGVAAVAAPLAWNAANRHVLEAATTRPQVESHVHVAAMATWLVVALVVRVVAEAFRIGTRLQEDVEGLV